MLLLKEPIVTASGVLFLMAFATPERRWQASALRSLILEAINSLRLEPFISRKAAARHFGPVTGGNVLSFAPWRSLKLDLWMRESSVR